MKKLIFGNVAGYRSAVLLKRNSFLGISQGFCLTDSVKFFEEKPFSQNTSSCCFCLCQQFPKKTKEVNILKVVTESFKSGVSRTLATTYKTEFFVTSAVGWKLV